METSYRKRRRMNWLNEGGWSKPRQRWTVAGEYMKNIMICVWLVVGFLFLSLFFVIFYKRCIIVEDKKAQKVTRIVDTWKFCLSAYLVCLRIHYGMKR
jgi:hypothetical protein